MESGSRDRRLCGSSVVSDAVKGHGTFAGDGKGGARIAIPRLAHRARVDQVAGGGVELKFGAV